MRGAVTTRLAGGFVYDSPSGTCRRADLLVHGERIVGLDQPRSDPDAIDVGGLYLLPGLIDCHVHLGMRAKDADPAAVAERPDATLESRAGLLLRSATGPRRRLRSPRRRPLLSLCVSS